MFRVLEPVMYNKAKLEPRNRCDFSLLKDEDIVSLVKSGVIISEAEYQEQQALIENADEKAENIINDAEKNAKQIISEAEEKAKEILADAEKNAKDDKGNK